MSLFILPRIKLDADQLLWLQMFHKIDLSKWRCLLLQRNPQKIGYAYVGNQKGGPERNKNIAKNRYYYWPKPPIEKLCPDQLLWLRMFHKIDLTEWRYEIVKYGKHRQPQEIDFVYLGVHYEDPNRAKNIEQNKYFYWPTPPVQDKHVE